ncbi:hypothetical protein WDW37_02720 [Bdellovibrionota bacterium FG-1]
MSDESGLVVGAMVGLTQKYGDGRLFPGVKPLFDATLRPETYTLDANGQLEVGLPLGQATPRFASVQVPEGPSVVQIEDNNRHPVWSQLVFAQPGVVNIIGE